MKKSIMKITGMTMFLFALNSCGGGGSNETATVEPEKTTISGDLGEYVEVVENKYEVSGNGSGELSIKVKALKPMTPDELEENDFELSASLLGENGMPVSGTDEFKIHYGSEDKLKSLLKTGSGEEVIKLETLLGGYWKDEHASKVKLFTVSSTVKKKEERNSTTSTSSQKGLNSSTSSTNSGSKDWDKMLDDYDDYVDEYIKFYKKAMNGDQSAMSEYPALMEKATNLQKSMEKAQNNNELSTAQVNRMMKIQTKMANAAMEMQ